MSCSERRTRTRTRFECPGAAAWTRSLHDVIDDITLYSANTADSCTRNRTKKAKQQRARKKTPNELVFITRDLGRRTSVSGTSTMYSYENGEKKERMYIRSLIRERETQRECVHLCSDAMLHGRLFERSANTLFKCIYKMTILKFPAIALAHSLVHHSPFDARISEGESGAVP